MVKRLHIPDYHKAMRNGYLCEDCGMMIDGIATGVKRKCFHCGNAFEGGPIGQKISLMKPRKKKNKGICYHSKYGGDNGGTG